MNEFQLQLNKASESEINIIVRRDRSVEIEVQWHDPEEIPMTNGLLKNISGDVLIFSKKTEEHTIGWFDHQENKWMFLCREPIEKFKWRYLNDHLDKT